MKPKVFAVGAAALTLLLAACGSSETASTPTPTTSDAAAGGIVIENFSYSGTLSVRTGEKVTVTNQDPVGHTLTSKTKGLFDTGRIDSGGGTGTLTAPTKAGTYPFGCMFHTNMAGTLVVAG